MKRISLIVGLVLAVVVIAAFTANWFRRGDPALTASGTLEARNASVGSKIGGRVAKVLAQEGDHVHAGQVLVTFEEDELAARLLQARGHLERARAAYSEMQHGSRPEDIEQARAAGGHGEIPGYRRDQIEQARSELERARADERDAETNFQRYQQLAEQGVVSRQARDDAESRYKMAKAATAAADHAVAAAEGMLREAKAIQKKAEHGFRPEEIAAAHADLVAAQGEVQQAESQWVEREVKSPAEAVVEVLDIRPGDLLAPNAPLAKLLEADQLFVMVYVPEPQIGRVRVGQRTQVVSDSYPGETFEGVVEQIRQKAEFLPRNVQTRDERQHQVIGVKVRVENRDQRLRAGVNADVRFAPEVK